MYKSPYKTKHKLIKTIVKAKPSQHNKSPYVGDIFGFHPNDMGITHMPSLDLGGKCVNGSEIIVRHKLDSKGNPVEQEYSKQYNTPSCMYITELVRSPHSHVWIGAHPVQGELLFNHYASTRQLPHFQNTKSLMREVANVAETNMRSDFLVTHDDDTHTLVEIKTIVDCDEDRSDNPIPNLAVFPWGTARQKDPETGKKVVSARAIKHVRELTSIAIKERTDARYPNLKTAIIFMVVREDAYGLFPDYRTCPVFAQELSNAYNLGVDVYAYNFKMNESGQYDLIGEIPMIYNIDNVYR